MKAKNVLILVLLSITLLLGADKFLGKKPEDVNNYLSQIMEMRKTVAHLTTLVGECKK